MNKKGFTMIEILIAIAILAVISMVVIPSIIRYVIAGKDTYNEKLENQLLVAGKNYFGDNTNLLPKKTYLDRNIEKHNYVTVPEMQTKNYLDKEFIDADGNSCDESFVFVTIPPGEKEEDWYACLRCEGENGEEGYRTENAYCDISNWDDKNAPVCGIEKGDKKGVTLSGGKKVGNKTYNPETVRLTNFSDDSGKIAYIAIRNITIDSEKQLPTLKKSDTEIKSLNLINYFFKDEKGKLIDGEYIIYIRDTGVNSSSICNERIIIDNTAPTCTINYDPKNSTDKNFKFSKNDNSVKNGWATTSSIKSTINQNKDKKAINKYTESNINKPTQDGTYYGHVEDEAGNLGICKNNVKIEMFSNEKPYCVFTQNVKANNTYLKKGATANLKVDCYVYQANKATYTKNKIIAVNQLGDVSTVENAKDNTNKNNKKMFNLTYTAKSSSGTDYVRVSQGFVTDINKKQNSAITSNGIKVDTIPPTLTQTTNASITSGGWYKAPLTVTATCTDKGGSGINKFTFNGQTASSGITKLSVTRSTAAKPVNYTASCTDKAGNSASNTKSYYVRVNSAHSSCGVKSYKKCTHKNCGVASYKSCRTSACGVASYKSCRTSACGVASYNSCRAKACGCATYNRGKSCGCNKYKTTTSNKTVRRECTRTKPSCPSGYKYVSHKVFTCRKGASLATYTVTCKKTTKKCTQYKRCKSAGCATYKSCRISECGVESYKTCWHY